SWFRPCRLLAVEGDQLTIAAPNPFSRDWLARNHLPAIQNAAQECLGGTPHVRLIVDYDPGQATVAPALPAPPSAGTRPDRRRSARATRGTEPRRAQPPLHVRHVRGRFLEPVRASRLPGGRGAPIAGLQSALHLRRGRPRQDSSAARGGAP